ncbi:cilia- and flagella-associated protein 337-like [Pagrus major]|uniref:cilia- and flagella-associated protein 337-like n=1 Tax=Pagrus major TaxID=143350 RepID=UPI003CC8DE37
MEDNSPKKTEKMFAAQDIPEIVRLFKEAGADDGKGLDKQEFCEVMKKIYSSVSEDELTALHTQIDSHCSGTVDLNELMAFRLSKIKAYEAMDYIHHSFPKSFQRVPEDCQVPIIGMVFLPLKDDMEKHYSADFRDVIRPYKQGQYLSLTSNGTLSIWTDKFEISRKLSLWERENTLPLSHIKKMYVVDMVYIRELQQLVISNFTRELFFYNCRFLPSHIDMKHSLVVEDGKVSAMNYWSNGTRAVFSIGDVAGFLTVFISHRVKKNDLFCKEAFEKVSLQKYPTVYVSALLNQNSSDFQCIKIPTFNDACSQIRYFPSLHSIAVCGKSFKRMVVAALPQPTGTEVFTEIFVSEGIYDFFTCVEYAPAAKQLVTGGTDGSLRVWFPNHTVCIESLKGHVKPITNLMYNTKDQIVISLSEDKNVRVWSEIGWLCRQSIQVENIGQSPITSMCYNIHNNELVLANSDITKCLGKGTDVFHESLTSHEKPLCCALYHSFFKRVISCCQNGVVTVWDILTGNAVMQFKVIPKNTNGRTFMSFDGQQQSLITVFQDGKVRRWNFSNGKKLSVHPVTVQKEAKADTATLLTSDDGYIYAWSVVCTGGLLGKFRAVKDDAAVITTMSTDVNEQILLTGDSTGRICLWDIQRFGFKRQSPGNLTPQQW